MRVSSSLLTELTRLSICIEPTEESAEGTGTPGTVSICIEPSEESAEGTGSLRFFRDRESDTLKSDPQRLKTTVASALKCAPEAQKNEKL